MTGVTMTVEGAEATAALERLQEAFADATPIMNALGVGLRENVHTRFEEEKAPDGSSWVALNPTYKADKRGPGILRESGIRGGLMGSIAIAPTSRSVEVGTNKVHGLIHQEGGTITPKNGDRLVFTIGGETIFATEVTIPARPYLGIGPEDEDTILDVIEGALDRATGDA